MRKRKKILLLSLSALIVAIIIGLLLLGQTPPTVSESSPPPTISESSPPPASPPETPPNLLVVPEVPLGTVAIVLACFFALLVTHRRSKGKLP